MGAERRYGGCGTDLPDGALGGLCPICLLRQGLAEGNSANGPGAPDDTISLFRPEAPVNLTTRVEESGSTPVAPPTAPGLHPLAERSGQYHLFGEIGRGGMGSILQALDLELGREVVLKVLQER